MELLNRTKSSNMYCVAARRHKPLLLSMWPGVLFSIILTGLQVSIEVVRSYSSGPFLGTCVVGAPACSGISDT